MTRPGLLRTSRWGGGEGLARLGTGWQPAQRRWGRGELEGQRARERPRDSGRVGARSETEKEKGENTEEKC